MSVKILNFYAYIYLEYAVFFVCFFFFVEADDLTQHITGYSVIDRA